MKAMEIRERFVLDALTAVDRPSPTAGPGTVTVRVRAVSLNYRDLMITRGVYNPKMPLPRVPCSDGAGEVIAVGSGVTDFAVGDRVCSTFFQNWVDGEMDEEQARSALGGDLDGMLAQEVVLSSRGVIKFPEHLSFEQAATLPCAALTAWNALFEMGRLKAGESVLVQGTGGVSIFALQFARLAGARVIATSSSDEKLARARELGASVGINYKKTPKWEDAVREATGGVGVDHVVEVGGAGTLAQSFKAVRRAGRISVIGVLSGGAEVNPMPILMRALSVQGIYVGSWRMFEHMNRAMTLARLEPIVDRVFEFGEARAALEWMAAGKHFGKIVIKL